MRQLITVAGWTAAAIAALSAGFGLAADARPATAPQVTAIVGATVFDATGAAPHPATVIISGDRIVDVGPSIAVPAGAKVIDAAGEALLPGFIDVHTHWTPSGSPGTTPQIANAYLAAGVTTTDDFNSAPEAFEPRRRWLAMLAAPHVNLTARMGVPGGHGADWGDVHTTKQFDTPEGARDAVREVVAYKPDLMKGFHDGWRYGSGADNNSMDLVTLTALVDEAHKNHLKVLTHTLTIARGKDAARAKVDVIAHSLQDAEIDQETVDLMKQNGTAYAPTLAVYEPVKPGKPARPGDPRYEQSVAKFDHALHNLKRLHDAGIRVALGTDAGMPDTPHGTSSLREMELMVRAGLTPTEALMAGTSDSAKVIGLGADRATIEKGKRADIVLLRGEPWKAISDVHKTDRVMVDGKLVFGPGAAIPDANRETHMPVVKVGALIDDFERTDGRTALGTLRTDDADGGPDRSIIVTTVINRTSKDHALSLSATMSHKPDPSAGAIFPLTRGSIEPADVRAYRGVRFDVRGGSAVYTLSANTLTGRWATSISAGASWKTVTVPFAGLTWAPWRGKASGAWTGDDLTEVEISASAQGGHKIWMQIDNLTFY